MPTFVDRITTELTAAMKARDAERVSTLRMLSSALKNERIAKLHDLSEDEALAVVKREVKRRNEAVETYRKGGREELAAKEEHEAALLQAYLPQAMSEDAVRAIVAAVITEQKPAGLADFGKVMGSVMKQAKNQADGSVVQRIVKDELAKLG